MTTDSDLSSDVDEQSEIQTENAAEHIGHLREHICSAETPWDLFNFAPIAFDRIKLNDLQSLLFAEIDEMNDKKVRILHYNSLPINKVFCADVIQHILSFGHCNQNRTVCQQWNRLNQQNEERMLREMYNAVDDWNLPPLESGGSIWVVHPKRPRLHPIEIRRGYSGPLKNLHPSKTIPKGISGRYLLHPGHYVFPDDDGPRTGTYTQYVGVSLPHSYGCYIEISSRTILSPPNKYHLENLIVNWYPDQIFRMLISKRIEFLFKQCTIRITDGGSMDVGDGGTLQLTDCIIESESDEFGASCGGIRISSGAKRVTINNNLFSQCLHCVLIMDRYKKRRAGGPSFLVKVEITSNRFQSTLKEHLVLMLGERRRVILLSGREDERTERLREQCTIHGNISILEGYQKLRYTTGKPDPNALYIGDGHELAFRTPFEQQMISNEYEPDL